MYTYEVINMVRKTPAKKVKEEAVTEDMADTSNDLDEIEAVSETVPEPVEVVRNDVLLPRRASRYKAML